MFHFVTTQSKSWLFMGEAVWLSQVYSNNNSIKTVASAKEGGRVRRLSLPNLATVPFSY